ncbi:phosphoethanolamine transferase [Xenophilus aerolatus]|nr:phosphoethanolamine--lipid A transferase [Xenophilus aerolatus]
MSALPPVQLPPSRIDAVALSPNPRSVFASLDAWMTRPRSIRAIVLALSVYLLLAANWPLWLDLARIGRAPSVYLVSIVGMAWLLLAGTVALLALTAWSRWMKPLWMLLVVVAALVQYYMFAYRMVMDPSMAANVMQTDPAEARDLMSLSMLGSVLLVSVPAVVWLWRVPVIAERWWSRLWRNAVLFVAAIAAAVAGGVAMSRTLAPLMRNETHVRYMMNPLASVYSAGAALARPMFQRSHKLVPITGGTALGASYAGQAKPPLLVLVVGETARADHFSLNGYARDTNPELAARQVVSFANVHSCGTNTLASVPCMFSHLGKQGYESRKNEYENLLDVLQAAGLAVLWIDNQAGCKGVCARVPNVQANDAKQQAAYPSLCSGDECLDEVMLKGLDERIAALPPERTAKGVVLVMHQLGSHGPAYYKRSSEALKRFQPECRTNTLSECSHAELMNAFDNTIAYTDHFLAGTIDWLKSRSGRYQTGMVYMSDHGESLGEYGLYLHGMPYNLAPEVQKHVPLVTWLDGGLGRRREIADACLRSAKDAELTHDNLYPTVLGLMDVTTPTYKPALDAFARCRPAPAG